LKFGQNTKKVKEMSKTGARKLKEKGWTPVITYTIFHYASEIHLENQWNC
jgi:hypothetical protein